MFKPASSTTPVTPAADQIEGGCAPAPAAHAVTSNAVISDVRILGVGFHLSRQRLPENRDRDCGLAIGAASVEADGQHRVPRDGMSEQYRRPIDWISGA